MQLAASIFKAYDIRGIVPSTVDEAVAEALGRAFGTIALREGESTVAVGRDGRLSGPMLCGALARGLVAAGIQVIDVGMVTTPMLYFAASTLCRSGIQVTGSHNPKDYNGFKMVLGGRAIYGDEIQALRTLMTDETWVLRAGGSIRSVDVFAAYRDRIVGDIRLKRPMKVVVDSGNGIAGASAPAILRAIGCEVIELFTEVDGNFPNHHPDPEQARQPARRHRTRCRPPTPSWAWPSTVTATAWASSRATARTSSPTASWCCSRRTCWRACRARTIVFDVKCSQQLAPAIRAAGGVPLMHQTGHSLIKARMKEVSAPLGGEMSGHIFFKERWYGFDDGTYAGCRLLEIVSRSPDANAVLNGLPTSYSTPELNVRCAEGEPHRVTDALQQVAAQALAAAATAQGRDPALARINTIDGLRVDWPDGFGLVRGSNTTPVLVLRFEGHTPEAMHRIEADMLALLRSVKPDATIEAAAH